MKFTRTADSGQDSPVANVKMPKQHIERRRRAKVTESIHHLRMLVPNTNNAASTVRLERAEILEQAVNHIQDSSPHLTDDSCGGHQMAAGYMSCLQEALQCLEDAEHAELRAKLSGYVADMLERRLASNKVSRHAQLPVTSPQAPMTSPQGLMTSPQSSPAEQTTFMGYSVMSERLSSPGTGPTPEHTGSRFWNAGHVIAAPIGACAGAATPSGHYQTQAHSTSLSPMGHLHARMSHDVMNCPPFHDATLHAAAGHMTSYPAARTSPMGWMPASGYPGQVLSYTF